MSLPWTQPTPIVLSQLPLKISSSSPNQVQLLRNLSDPQVQTTMVDGLALDLMATSTWPLEMAGVKITYSLKIEILCLEKFSGSTSTPWVMYPILSHPPIPSLVRRVSDKVRSWQGVIDVCVEVYALGLRNPWRASFDSVTGALYVGDVGHGTIEEMNIIVNGGNYGWRKYEVSHFLYPVTSPLYLFMFLISPRDTQHSMERYVTWVNMSWHLRTRCQLPIQWNGLQFGINTQTCLELLPASLVELRIGE